METSEGFLEQDERLKQVLFKRQITAFLVFSAIVLPASWIRIFQTGFRPVYAVHGAAVLTFLVMLLLRRHFSPKVLVGAASVLLIVAILAGVITFGVLAAGHVLIPTIIILSCMILGRKAAAWLLLGTAIGLVFVATLHLTGTIHSSVDLREYALSWSAWLLVLLSQLTATAWYLFLYQPIGEMQRRASEYLAAVFQGINDALFIHDRDTGAILNVNQKGIEMYGYSSEEVCRLRVEDLSSRVSPYTQEDADARMRLAAQGTPQLFEWQARHRTGKLFWVEVSMRLANLDGKERILVVVRDISERKRAEQELQLELRLSGLLTEIAATSINLPLDAVGSEIVASLGKMAELVGADRAYIFDYAFKADSARITHEWHRDGLTAQAHLYQALPLSRMPAADAHRRGEVDFIPDVSLLSDSRRRIVAEQAGTASRLTMPLMRSGECLGFVGFSWATPHEAYSVREMRLLTFFSNILVNLRRRKEADDDLRASVRRYETLVENSPDVIARFDLDLRYLFVNSSITKVSPIKPEDFKGKTMRDVGFTEEQAEKREARIREVIASGVPAEAEFEFTVEGKLRIYEWRAYPELDEVGAVQSVLTLNRDITARKRGEEEHRQLQARLGQAQKMEAIGTLAGGIAHDFNNILSAILGCNDLAIKRCQDEEQLDDLKMVAQAARRATELVKQILDFSRMSNEEAKPVQPQIIVHEALKLLHASIPSTIEIRENLVSRSLVLAEPGEIHRMVINLCTNAALAIAGTDGVIDIGLDNVDLDAQFAISHPGVAPGHFVRLTVKDNGRGMTEEVKARIFEPYFTTRPSGEGTGMGLAVVHGVVHKRGGTVSVASAPGLGTTFQVLLPVTLPTLDADAVTEEPAATGSERILFVDDEPMLVDVACRSLAGLGYKVTPMTSGLDAVARFKAAPTDFDLVVTDMTMPKMTGDELATAIRAMRPDIPVILCSGYSERIRSAKAGVEGIDAIAFKPVSAAALSRIIRKVLQSKVSARA